MSRARRDSARFDRWAEKVFRGAEARERTLTWSRHLVTRDGDVRPLQCTTVVPSDARVYWVGDYPRQRVNNWMTWSPPSVAIREDEFVHPSWRHPSPAPRTKNHRRSPR